MKLSRTGLRLGIKARKAVAFPVRDAPLPLEGVALDALPDGLILVDVRPLSTDERCDAIARAQASVKARGGEARDGTTLYDLAVMAETCAIACVDHESPLDAPEPFFDGLNDKGEALDPDITIARVKQALQLDTDRLSHLYESFSAWEDTCNPRRLKLSMVDYMMWCSGLAQTEDGDDRFFGSLPLGTLRSLARTMARQLAISLAASSPPSSASPDTRAG